MTIKLYSKDLAKAMSLNCDKMYTIYECQDFLDIFRRTIEDLILDGSYIILTGFMSFSPKYSKPRVMHSGLTGKDYEVPAGMTMKASVSPAFQEELKRNFLERKKDE